MSRFTSERGMSLIEVLIGIVLLGVLMAGLAVALVGAMKSSLTSEVRTRAVQLAARSVEEAQSVNWRYLGMSSTDPTLPTGTTTHDGESVVFVTADVAGQADVPKHVRTSTVDNQTFTTTTWVTWVGAPNDGTVYAAKRIAVTVAWTEPSGASRSLSSTAVRAPSNAEMSPPSVGLGLIATLDPPGQTLLANGRLSMIQTFSATTGVPVQEVRVTYSRNGTPETLALTSLDNRTWTGSRDANYGPFAAGVVPVTFTAVDILGDSETVTKQWSLQAPAPVLAFDGTPLMSPATLQLVTNNALPSDLTVAATFLNGIPSSVIGTYPLPGGGTGSLTFTGGGSTWTASIPAGTQLAIGSLAVTVVATPVTGQPIQATSTSVVLTAPALNSPNVATTTFLPSVLCLSPTGTVKVQKAFAATAEILNISASQAPTITIEGVNRTGVIQKQGQTPKTGPSGGLLFKGTWGAGTTMSAIVRPATSATLTVSGSGGSPVTTYSRTYTVPVEYHSGSGSDRCP